MYQQTLNSRLSSLTMTQLLKRGFRPSLERECLHPSDHLTCLTTFPSLQAFWIQGEREGEGKGEGERERNFHSHPTNRKALHFFQVMPSTINQFQCFSECQYSNSSNLHLQMMSTYLHFYKENLPISELPVSESLYKISSQHTVQNSFL